MTKAVKAILFDADGVVIKKRDHFFSVRFAEKYGVRPEDQLPFFKEDMRSAFVGKADLRESLKKYLPKWNWKGTADEYLAYWFGEESPRDEAVIAYIDELRGSGIKCYLATDREPLWGEYLKNEVGLAKHLDGFCYSYMFGHEKSEPEFFAGVQKMLGVAVEDLMYWDDDQKNVDVAKSVGIDARFFTNLNDLKAAYV